MHERQNRRKGKIQKIPRALGSRMRVQLWRGVLFLSQPFCVLWWCLPFCVTVVFFISNFQNPWLTALPSGVISAIGKPVRTDRSTESMCGPILSPLLMQLPTLLFIRPCLIHCRTHLSIIHPSSVVFRMLDAKNWVS